MEALLESAPFLSVVPLLVMLVLVVTTRRVFESIVIAVALVFVLSDGINFIDGFQDSVFEVFAEGTFPWILMVLTLFGALIALMIKSDGISAFRRFASKYIRSERSSLVFTWILGVVIFIDEYISNLGIGPTVRDITDKHKVPREQLGFIICCLGSPVIALVPMTAVSVFVFGIMMDYGISAEDSHMVTEYLKLIPFMFYPIVIIIIALLLAVGILPRVGAFKKYYQQLHDGTYQLTEKELAILKENEGQDEIVIDETKGSIIDFVAPILSVVAFMIPTGDLVLSVIVALIVAFVLYIFRKKMTITEYFKSFFSGVTDMVFILTIVFMTFIFVEGLENIGFSSYVIETVEPMLVGGAIPALAFIVVGVSAFLGVDWWAVMILFAPIAIPLAEIFSVSPYMTMAAVVSGAIFGGTACFFAEQILMCSHSVQRPPVRVALGGLPYSILGFILTVILYLIFGFAL